MKKIIMIIFLLASAPTYSNNESQKTEQQKKHDAAQDIDDLLSDALEDGVKDEVIEPKEVSTAEVVLRKIGGVMLSGYFGAKYYACACWRAIAGTSHSDEEQSSDTPETKQE